MHACGHVCMYAYMHVCMCTCLHVCTYVCVCVWGYVCTYDPGSRALSPRPLRACNENSQNARVSGSKLKRCGNPMGATGTKGRPKGARGGLGLFATSTTQAGGDSRKRNGEGQRDKPGASTRTRWLLPHPSRKPRAGSQPKAALYTLYTLGITIAQTGRFPTAREEYFGAPAEARVQMEPRPFCTPDPHEAQRGRWFVRDLQAGFTLKYLPARWELHTAVSAAGPPGSGGSEASSSWSSSIEVGTGCFDGSMFRKVPVGVGVDAPPKNMIARLAASCAARELGGSVAGGPVAFDVLPPRYGLSVAFGDIDAAALVFKKALPGEGR